MPVSIWSAVVEPVLDARQAHRPAEAVNALGVTLFDQLLPIGIEGLILLGFGIAMLGFGVVNFRRRD